MRTTSVSLSLAVVLGLAAPSAVRGQINAGPWNLTALQQAPQVAWVDQTGVLRRLFYQSEPVKGKPTRVFAYYAQPALVLGKLPGIVLVHGGGARAFPEWALMWAKRGYAALAIDVNGCGPDGTPLPDGMPSMTGEFFMPSKPTPLTDIWSYHAVAAVIRGVSLLRSLPQVNPLLVSVHGVSWGGYLTCIAAGIDIRIRSAVPVFGCGFLLDGSPWKVSLASLPPAWRAAWLANFDASVYLPQARMPMLFLTDTNDGAFDLDSFQRSSQLVRLHQLCVVANMKHSHQAAWERPEPGIFIDSYSKRSIPLPQLTLRPLVQLQALQVPATPQPGMLNSRARQGAPGRTVLLATLSAPYKSLSPISGATLTYTCDGGPWQNRRWASAPAALRGGMVVAQLPTSTPLYYFLTLTDRRGASVTTEVLPLNFR